MFRRMVSTRSTSETRTMRSVAVAAIGTAIIALSVTACSDDSPAAPTSNAATIEIAANNGSQSFSPNPAPAGGQMAVWRNDHGETHRIVANDGSFDTGDLAPGATSAMVQLPAAGLNYHCDIHPTMIGAVGGAGGAAPPPCTDYC